MANRFVSNAVSYHGKGAIQEIPGLGNRACVTADKFHVIAAGDKADILAVLLPGVDKALLLGNLPGLLLGQLSEGEQGVDELMLIHACQKIGLILGGIQRLI